MIRLGALPPAVARALRIASVVLLALILLWLVRDLSTVAVVVVAVVLVGLVVKIGMYEGSWRGWWTIKLREWATDIQQLWLWLQLAFKRERDDHDVVTMLHQQRFLEGRMASPLNLLRFAGILLIVLFVSGGLNFVQEWRIARVKRERDAPCSPMELSRDRQGDFRTSRASCAALGATNEVAAEWRARAEEERAQRETQVASIRAETAAEIQRQQAAAQRRAELAARQRRRENEGIEAALGGPPPDLERSLCELAGRSDCGSAGTDAGGDAAPAPSAVPDGGR